MDQLTATDQLAEVPIVSVPEMVFSFPGLANGSQQLTVLERIDLLQWRELTLRVHVHSHTLTGSNVISVALYPQSWTEEDPGLIFIDANSAGGTTILASATSPCFQVAAISTLGADGIAALGALRVTGTRASGGTIKATLSIDICAKDA